MNEWIRILTLTYPHEAHLAKSKLESEGIDVFIKDELTAQVNNFYSNAIGGVKLLVKERDWEHAYRILKESGYIKESKHDNQKIIKQLDKLTSKLPFIGKSILEQRLLVIVAIVVIMIIVPAVLAGLPSKKEKLTKNFWCIDNFIYKNQNIQPNTLGIKVINNNVCTETLNFNKNGIVYLPGLNSYSIHANWRFEKNNLIIYHSDTLSYIYDGTYSIDISHQSITIKSDNTIISGHQNR